MSKLNLPLLSRSNANDIDIFIEFWHKLYSYDKEKLYSENIGVTAFSESNIEDLYIWKNTTPLSALKENSLQKKIIKELELINNFRDSEGWTLDVLNQKFESVSAVWRIFLFHIIKPNTYPIYDQHIHRAYQYINGLSIEGINTEIKDSEKLEFYKQKYLPFVKNLKVSDLKKMDEAFFSFGQFLNTGQYKRMII